MRESGGCHSPKTKVPPGVPAAGAYFDPNRAAFTSGPPLGTVVAATSDGAVVAALDGAVVAVPEQADATIAALASKPNRRFRIYCLLLKPEWR